MSPWPRRRRNSSWRPRRKRRRREVWRTSARARAGGRPSGWRRGRRTAGPCGGPGSPSRRCVSDQRCNTHAPFPYTCCSCYMHTWLRRSFELPWVAFCSLSVYCTAMVRGCTCDYTSKFRTDLGPEAARFPDAKGGSKWERPKECTIIRCNLLRPLQRRTAFDVSEMPFRALRMYTLLPPPPPPSPPPRPPFVAVLTPPPLPSKGFWSGVSVYRGGGESCGEEGGPPSFVPPLRKPS